MVFFGSDAYVQAPAEPYPRLQVIGSGAKPSWAERYQFIQILAFLRFHRQSSILGNWGTRFFVGTQEVSLNLLLSRFWNDETGATAIEYALIAAGISLAIIAAVNGVGTKLNASFGTISSSLK